MTNEDIYTAVVALKEGGVEGSVTGLGNDLALLVKRRRR